MAKLTKAVDYSDALRMIKGGHKMRRLEWRPNKWVQQCEPVGSLSYLEMELIDGRRAPYTPSRCDQYIDDWVSAIVLTGRAALQDGPAER